MQRGCLDIFVLKFLSCPQVNLRVYNSQMNSEINNIYVQINETFNGLLSLKERDSLESYMQSFREKIALLEKLPDVDLKDSLKNNQELIIKIFQFKAIAQDKIWSNLPKINKCIADLVSIPTSYEFEFRLEVEKFGWGELLDYIKD